jgi:hypothetical protein
MDNQQFNEELLDVLWKIEERLEAISDNLVAMRIMNQCEHTPEIHNECDYCHVQDLD